MLIPAARRLSTVALCATLAMFAPGCGDTQPGRPDAGRAVRKLHWHPAAAGHRLQDVHHRLLTGNDRPQRHRHQPHDGRERHAGHRDHNRHRLRHGVRLDVRHANPGASGAAQPGTVRAQRRQRRRVLRADLRLPDGHGQLHVDARRGRELRDDGEALLRQPLQPGRRGPAAASRVGGWRARAAALNHPVHIAAIALTLAALSAQAPARQPQRVEAVAQSAWEALNAGRVAEAERLFDEALKAAPASRRCSWAWPPLPTLEAAPTSLASTW